MSKTKAQLEAEVASLRRAKAVSGVIVLLRTLIIACSVVACFYFTTSTIKELAGKETWADIGIHLLGSLTVSVRLAWILTVSGVFWAILERKLRQRVIRRMSGRVAEFERQLDPERSSSRLTQSGDTNPRDRLR